MKRLKIQSLATLAALVLLLLGAWFVVGRYNSGGFSRSELSAYDRFYQALPEDKEKIWRKGLVLVMMPSTDHTGGAAVHEAQWKLSDELQAQPGKVDTVIMVTTRSFPVGNYTNGAVAYKSDVTLTAFDAKSGKLMGRKNLSGQPPSKIVSVQFVSGTGTVDIVKAIESLPTSKP